ncbi:hypothetical protein M2454_000154 [Aequitasia blattaphilus]
MLRRGSDFVWLPLASGVYDLGLTRRKSMNRVRSGTKQH